MIKRANRADARAGFTAIEMMVVLTVIIGLASVTAVSLGPALRQGRLSEAANYIDRCTHEARQLARMRSTAAAVTYYGVKLVTNQSPNYVAVVYGSAELSKFTLNRNLQIFLGNGAATTAITWFNQPLTGYVMDAAGTLIDVGAVPLGDPNHLSVRTLDGRLRSAIAVYRIGLLNTESF